ncbi:fatty-acyl-CoA synthase [Exophiala viscosa]|uniref:fatty-acyl-CoA synthase n=1 Tax=Exophiala viscosa TaxID=2486360 RepID=UPI002198724D|nr:fatty-acyl-CoA synthase [Exophiala viscosa]
MSLATTAAAAAVSTALGLYLNARYSIGSDIAQIRGARRIQKYAQRLYEEHGEDDWSFYHVLHCTYGSNDDQEAFVFEGRSWTDGRFREDIGRCAEALKRLGVRNRMVVGLFINNSPEFMFTWWALYKIGAIPAPINTSITGAHIKHCLMVSEAEMLITTFELSSTIAKTFDLNDGTKDFRGDPLCPRLGHMLLYDYDTYPFLSQWSTKKGVTLLQHSKLPPATREIGDFPKSSRPKVLHTDASQYLFTSGTTGLPKALIWPAGYSLTGSCPNRYPGMNARRRRFYICLPMFHGTATFAALPATFTTSGTVILARRFSRREFWADVRRSKANAILYIGEMLRYLVQSPPDPQFPDEKDHGVDLAFGLGLAPTVWRAVRERFGIPWIVEYYSASEATTSILVSNKNDLGVGKVGRWGPLMRSNFFQDKFYIVRTDLEIGEILRDPKTGFCMRTRPGEVGESICRIAPPVQRRHDYVGEGGQEATQKKVIKNVFARGDEFFRLGDAMVIDEDGFVSFHDRLGDTYRAKGHNISTTEVEGCLSRHPSIASVNVYAIPMNRYGYDGQLGCAAITFTGGGSSTSDKPDVQELDTIKELEKWATTDANALPGYAVPRFLRVLVSDRKEINSGNDIGADRVSLIMKKLKTGLRSEGFVLPADGRDRIYWIEKEGSGYVPLTTEVVQALLAGKARL